jgi:hypothetical protein
MDGGSAQIDSSRARTETQCTEGDR